MTFAVDWVLSNNYLSIYPSLKHAGTSKLLNGGSQVVSFAQQLQCHLSFIEQWLKYWGLKRNFFFSKKPVMNSFAQQQNITFHSLNSG